MGWKIGLSFETVSIATGSSAAAGHPASNAPDVDHQFRTWLATTGVGANLVLDYGAASQTAALLITNTNMATVGVEYSLNGSAWTTVSGSPFTINEGRTGRRNAWLDLTGVSALSQYIRLTAASLAAGETATKIGAVGSMLAANILTMSDCPAWPYQYAIRLPVTSFTTQGGAFDVNEEGEPYIELAMRNPAWLKQATPLAEFRRLQNIRTRTIAVFENMGHTEDAYFMKRTSDIEYTDNFRTFEAAVAFRELA